ncbi:MAG: UDP-N-acetylmuramoyl-tripeptide--D-alanyl-D-alanine ligase [Candidatus Thiodiazotropha sp. (ex Myrtea spinifera)]|nr:UDP-N-acetylmuramoyl-tripeptide--D-alanyl-D-alanine ligase [Candidatus Thiodiazotropha sp. (ex Myrtea spinifera)]MCU7827863.1 UDP-N-acetylmuramoyl-tripeptide--D-alanyl-D-alanine ligase [Candidatus Thiodiazotropha sp. (ex Myrtea sp. 'scaly one' KF741663)]
MNSLSLSQVTERLDSVQIGADVSFSAVSTDTRTLQSDDLFVALKGPNFDGHRFIPQAIENGAAALMVSEVRDENVPQIRVDDTRLGLGRLAALWRDRFSVPMIGITGSNGKTTVKELTAAILGQRGPVLATPGNLNNDIGLPLTLLQLQDESFAVIEMGANHPGEIGYLTQIARPDVAVITNAGAAHLEGFGDLQGVAQAKGEILSGLNPQGVAVLNADDDYFPLWRQLLGERRMISFGGSPRAQVRTDLNQAVTRWSDTGFSSHMTVSYRESSFDIELALAGRHNLLNALAAIAAALAMNCTISQIQRGLASVEPVNGRLCTRVSASGLRLVDDTYNANPDSVEAAIQVLREAPGGQWLVLGDLAELGEEAVDLHADLGKRARQADIEHLYTLGSLSSHAAESFGEGAKSFQRIEDLVNELALNAKAGDTLLIKGSRSAGMERVLQQLMDMGRT